MIVATLGVTQEQAFTALREYKQHRSVYDKRDWEIERIYRQISKGKTVISVNESIVRAGFDELGRPRLAIARADDEACLCRVDTDEVIFAHTRRFSRRSFKLHWPGAKYGRNLASFVDAIVGKRLTYARLIAKVPA